MTVPVFQRRALALTLAAGILALASPGASAETYLHRCGPDGRTYSQTPCRSGPGTVMKVQGDASGSRQADGLQVARRDARLARTLEADRRKRQKEVVPGGAAIIPVRPVSVGEPDAPPPKKKTRRRHKDFTARVPKPPKP